MDVALCGFFSICRGFFVKREWGVVGDGVPNVVFCKP